MSLQTAYADASIFQRALVAARPLICPPVPILDAIPSNVSVLDIGCGVGALLISLAERGCIASGIGCDVNERAISVAKSAAARIGASELNFVVTQNVSEIPLGPFDVVTMIDVIHHVAPDAQHNFFQACIGRVKPGGLLVYKDMANRPIWKNLFNRLHDAVIARQMIHYVPLPMIKAWATDAGLNIGCEESYSRFAYAHELLLLHKRGT